MEKALAKAAFHLGLASGLIERSRIDDDVKEKYRTRLVGTANELLDLDSAAAAATPRKPRARRKKADQTESA